MSDRLDDNEIVHNKSLGDTPDFEVQLIPSWIVFTATDNYRIPQCGHFKIKNVDVKPIVYRIRTRDRLFPRFSKCHGYLEPNEEDEVLIVIPTSDYWPRDPLDYAGRRHRIMIENLTVPSDVCKPKDKNEAVATSAMIFKATPPMTRMYTKLNILLPKIVSDKASETSTGI